MSMTAIEINPKIRFGKPIIRGTRIAVDEVLGMLAGGMEFDEIKKEYGLTKTQITDALKYFEGWVKGETIKTHEVPARR